MARKLTRVHHEASSGGAPRVGHEAAAERGVPGAEGL